MKNKRGFVISVGISKIVNSKPFIGLMIFIVLGLGMVVAGDVIFKEGNLEVGKDLNASGSLYVNSSNGNVGIGTSSPEITLHVKRIGATTDLVWNGLYIVADKSTNMADGFGTGLRFRIEDDANIENTIAEISAVRDGADNSGKIILRPYSAGVSQTGVLIDNLGKILSR